MTLSSGVFGQSVETKNGIEVFNQNAGQSKDLFNPYRPPNNDEIKHLQKIVDEVYEDFVTKVSKSRKIDIEFIKNNVGALIYSSNQALDNFLIDDILEYNTLITYIVNENKLEDYKIFENKTKKTFIGNFFAKYSNDIDSWSIYKNICKNLELSVSVIIPTFYKNC